MTAAPKRDLLWMPETANACMTGTVIWYHPGLRFGFIECLGGLTLGTVERGCLDLFDQVRGPLAASGPATLANVSTGKAVLFDVEANALSEDQANELLGLVQG